MTTTNAEIGPSVRLTDVPQPLLDGALFAAEVPPNPAGTLTATLERRLTRLAYDLHDGALQEVAALAADLAAARQQILPVVSENSRGRVSGRLDDLKAQLTELDESLRSLVHTVRGGSDVSEALDTSIAREVAGLRDKIGVEAELEFVGSFAELTDSRRIAIIRIVKEALSNVREHSGARHVRIRVAEQSGRVEVSVEDDGVGFDFEPTLAIAQHDYRFGLIGMQDRVGLLGGALVIDTAPGRGTRLSFTLDPWFPPVQMIASPSDLVA